MTNNAVCCACREALHTWEYKGMPYCDACYWEVTAPFYIKRGDVEYDATQTKGIVMTDVQWLVVRREDKATMGSRMKLSSAHSLCSMFNANAGHTVEVEYSE